MLKRSSSRQLQIPPTYLFARITPSFPGGHIITIRFFLFGLVRLAEAVEKLAPGMLDIVIDEVVVALSWSKAFSCISNRFRSFSRDVFDVLNEISPPYSARISADIDDDTADMMDDTFWAENRLP
jgi:hypothetical protein